MPFSIPSFQFSTHSFGQIDLYLFKYFSQASSPFWCWQTRNSLKRVLLLKYKQVAISHTVSSQKKKITANVSEREERSKKYSKNMSLDILVRSCFKREEKGAFIIIILPDKFSPHTARRASVTTASTTNRKTERGLTSSVVLGWCLGNECRRGKFLVQWTCLTSFG